MSNWNTAKLGDYLDALLDYRGKSPPKSESGIPVLSAKVVKTSGLLNPIEQRIAPEYYPKWMIRGLPKAGDVVFTTEGPMGEVIQLTEETAKYALGQRIVTLRGKKGILDNAFLRYLLTAPHQQAVLASYATGTTVLGISQAALRSVPITFPKWEEQLEIAEVLSALDDKIELNRRMNETLEALAQAIFKDWFVTFGPTRRKMDGPPDPVAILGGLIPDPTKAAPFAALFPDSLGENGLPEGWEEASLDVVCSVNDESWKASNPPEEVNYVDLSNTKWGVIEATSVLSWEEAPSRARRIARPGDTIVGTVRPGNGSYAFISEEGYTASTGFAVLRPTRPEYANFVYIASTRPDNVERLANLADSHGGAYPAVNPGEVTSTKIAYSGEPALLAFDLLAGPFRERIEHNKQENRTLAETRDYLLPKLMSGAVRMRDAEKAVS